MRRGAPGRVEVGIVARAHGVRGEVRMVPHDPESVALEQTEEVFIGGRPLSVVRSRRVPGAFLVRLAGVDDRDAAEALAGERVEVGREALDLREGEVLLIDLVGCEAVLEDGTHYGTVAEIDVGSAQSRLVVRDGEVERLLPVADEIVVEIDLEGGKVVVRPPEGLPESPAGA